jgi:hypothetical protein
MNNVTTLSPTTASTLANSAINTRLPQTPDPVAISAKIIADNGGRRPNLSEIKRSLDAIRIQDPALGAAVRTEVERLLTPVQRGQLASATYVQNGVTTSRFGRPQKLCAIGHHVWRRQSANQR